LAAVAYWGKPFGTATYSLKGDGPLIVSSYKIVETIKSAIDASDTPNVCGVIKRLSSKLPVFQRSQNLFDYARKCVQPGIDGNLMNKAYHAGLLQQKSFISLTILCFCRVSIFPFK